MSGNVNYVNKVAPQAVQSAKLIAKTKVQNKDKTALRGTDRGDVDRVDIARGL